MFFTFQTPFANEENNNNWADFESSSISFAQTTNEIPVVTTSVPSQEKENNNDDDFGDFNEIPTTTEIFESEPAEIQAEDDDFGEFSEIQTTTEIVESESAQIQEEDDDFGEFSEVQTAPPQSQTSSTPTVNFLMNIYFYYLKIKQCTLECIKFRTD